MNGRLACAAILASQPAASRRKSAPPTLPSREYSPSLRPFVKEEEEEASDAGSLSTAGGFEVYVNDIVDRRMDYNHRAYYYSSSTKSDFTYRRTPESDFSEFTPNQVTMPGTIASPAELHYGSPGLLMIMLRAVLLTFTCIGATIVYWWIVEV